MYTDISYIACCIWFPSGLRGRTFPFLTPPLSHTPHLHLKLLAASLFLSFLIICSCHLLLLPLSPHFSPFLLSSLSHHHSLTTFSLRLSHSLSPSLVAAVFFSSSNNSRKLALGLKKNTPLHLFSLQFLPCCRKRLQKRQIRNLKNTTRWLFCIYFFKESLISLQTFSKNSAWRQSFLQFVSQAPHV